MALIQPTRNARAGLSPAERAELCGRVDFPALLRSYGVEVPNRKPMICALRPERTPSCHLYPPHEGLLGARGWTWKDYGSGEGGDALGYLIDCRRLDFMEAVRLLSQLTGFVPECLEGEDPHRARPVSKKLDTSTPSPAPVPKVPTMAEGEQAEACRVFLAALDELNPTAADEGGVYLNKLRKLHPQGFPPLAYHLPESIAADLAQILTNSPHLELLIRAGLMKPAGDGKPARPQWGAWAGDVVLFAHHNAAGDVLAFNARRVFYKAGDAVGKYLQQTFSRGAVRVPFGLPTLYRPPWLQWKPARGMGGQVILCEGVLDAVGAFCLGVSALGLCMRPQARNYKDTHGASPRMLDPHLEVLSECERVIVLPDNDPDPEQSAAGAKLAAGLVAYLKAAGCRAEIMRLAELSADLGLPEPEDCKDLADLATKDKTL